MNKEQDQVKKGRRGFLGNLISGGIILLIPKFLKAKEKKGNPVKFLTAEGKVVEVDNSVVEKITNAPVVSNKAVLEWMNTKSANNL